MHSLLTATGDESFLWFECAGRQQMSSSEEAADNERPFLEIELVEISKGCLARFSGDLVAETRAGLWSIEPMLVNEVRVALDVSGVTSIDGSGLEAALRLINTVHTFGGTVTFGGEQCSRDGGVDVSTAAPDDPSPGVLGRLGVLRNSQDHQRSLW
jgi:ABC-type transporter Mla MlaB component